MNGVGLVLRRIVAAILLAVTAGLFALPAQAAMPGFERGSICHISAKQTQSYRTLARDPKRWTCQGNTFQWHERRHLVRIDLRQRPVGPQPRFAEFERHPFERLTATVYGSDGSSASHTYSFRETALGASSLRSIIALPELDVAADSVVFTLDDGYFPEVLLEAELRAQPSVRIVAGIQHLLAALICGLLIAPMLFDLGYWRTLRESFPLFHALFCMMAFIQTAAVSGLIPLVTSLSFDAEMYVTYLSLDMMVAANYLFAFHFIESRALRSWQRRILAWLAVINVVNGIVTSVWVDFFGAWVDHIYLSVFVGSLGAYFYVLYRAWRGGSSTAPYLFLGLAPFSCVTTVQLATVYFPSLNLKFDETWPQNLALLFEVVATALAVADRFMAARRERDMAVDKARILGALSELDDLTGLLNRRALDAHYPTLLAEGFTTLALIDLDHFKSINDIHGHPVGDSVLRCVASALEAGDERDARAFRMGGEEFLLLLRGPQAEQRAEQRRRAISTRVASDIQALDKPVTASMGLIDFSAIASEDEAIDFSTLYSRADWLLYEAKRQGRNRTLSERLTHFEPEGSQGWKPAADAA